MILEREEIEKILPHRGRALLLDKAELEKGSDKATGFLTVRDEHCEGHFPGSPIMRGVDRIEMIALTLGLAAQADLPPSYLPFLVGLDKIKFPDVAVLGDLVRTEAIITRKGSRIIKGQGEAYVGEKLIAEVGEIVLVIGQ